MARIVCTISPDTEFLKGVDLVRVNGAFGTLSEIEALIRPYRNVSVLVDLPRGRKKKRTSTFSDDELLSFCVKQKIDYVGLSYVSSPRDVLEIREQIAGSTTKIISKVENRQAIENLDSIIAASDAIMIDRGDLGTDIGFEKVPHLQKRIIHKCNEAGKPVIVATEMLFSMLKKDYPTKAEILDIANAVSDGADYVMLSEETAIGEFPNKAIEVLRAVIDEVSQRMKVLILAAGTSPQFGGLTADKPRCLLDVGGESILQHQIGNMTRLGIDQENILVATGYRDGKIRESIKSRDVQYVYNPWYDTTNMLSSIWMARDRLRNGFILVYGDILFEHTILESMMQRVEDIVIAVEKKRCDEDDEKVCVRNGLMTLHPDYEALPEPKQKCIPLADAFGEFIGIARFSRLGANRIINETEEIVRERKFDASFLYALERLVKKQMPVRVEVLDDRLWCDIDSLEDLQSARTKIYPRIALKSPSTA